MTNLLVAVILSVCQGHDIDNKDQVITNHCQEQITNCAVGKAGKITAESIQKCVERYEDEKQLGRSKSGTSGFGH